MSAKRDEGFEYLALQTSLADALRAGFLSLAQARYSMGPDRVSAVQFPSLMTATAHVHAAGDGRLVLAKGSHQGDAGSAAKPADPSPVGCGSSNRGRAEGGAVPSVHAADFAGPYSSSSSAESSRGDTGATRAGQGAAGSSSSASMVQDSAEAMPTAAAAPAEDAAVEEQMQRLRLAAEQNGDVLQQLAAKYGCEGRGQSGGSSQEAADSGHASSGGGQDDEEYAEVAPPGRPLSWFGTLVAPSLRQAEAHFGEALALAVQAANAQRRLRQGVDAWRAAGPAMGSAAASQA
ncbi:hypothetical protein ABPG77_001650 [Micractinium sp. CCAP 211/92]